MKPDEIIDIKENSRLSHQEAQVFFLRYREGDKISEISDKLRVSENTVRKVLDRIKKKKSECLRTVEILEDVDT
jgi:DNA-directed RNA polymerase specialized sigma24 family protein